MNKLQQADPIRALTDAELDGVAGGPPIIGFLAGYIGERLLD
jgi:hypothetical protein